MGEIEFFTENKNICSIISLDFCSILQLQKKEFLEIININEFIEDMVIFKFNFKFHKNLSPSNLFSLKSKLII
jgi:hypothetical protein